MQVIIDKLDHFGRGITYIDKKICFVKGALPGELVEIKIVKETKKYLEAVVYKLLDSSINREEVRCPFYDRCGGCCFSHLSFVEENKYKLEKVKEIMERFAGISRDKIEGISYTESEFYRNKITLHGKEGQIGYYKEGSKSIVPVNNCLLVDKRINDLVREIKQIDFKGKLEKIVIRVSNDSDKIMLKLVGNNINYHDLLCKCDVLVVNDLTITKNERIISSIGNRNYFLSIDSFFQINKTLTEKLYGNVRDIVRKSNAKKVLDLYCGVGTIGLYVNDLVDEVIGIDSSSSNIGDAVRNKELNNALNVTFMCERVENVISNFCNDIDLVIVDPPRAGLDSATKQNICRIASQKIVYVSCDSVTLARDIKDLDAFYQVEGIRVFNMFPRTYHVECVCVLNRR